MILRKKYTLLTLIIIVALGSNCNEEQKVLVYKQVDGPDPELEIYYPVDYSSDSTGYPAIVFFFGGGWINGSREQFSRHARYFSERNAFCFLADYRTRSLHGTTPFQALEDARSSIRFIRSVAMEFGIDTSRIVAAGGSAGGHLAAATALVDGYNDPADSVYDDISCIPNALVLFCPVIDNGPGGYGYERVGDAYHRFSPLHNIRPNAPPTLILQGTNDRYIPMETVERFCMLMQENGNPCKLIPYAGQGHGFFLHNEEYHVQTLEEMEVFLTNAGILYR